MASGRALARVNGAGFNHSFFHCSPRDSSRELKSSRCPIGEFETAGWAAGIITRLETAKLRPRIVAMKLEAELFDNLQIGFVELASIAKPSRETELAVNELRRARMEFPGLNFSVLFKTFGSKVDDQAENLTQFT